MPQDVLSQEEIDMLLGAISSGEIQAEQLATAPEARPYDFRRPNKFSKDQLRTLYMIHDNFSRLLSNYLSAYLRASVQVKIASVDQLTYEDFVVSIPAPTLMTFFSMPPLKGTAILESNATFVFIILDLLFGGKGTPPEHLREPTDIEINVMRRVSQKMLEQLVYAWGEVFQFEPVIESMETNPQFNQIISPNETVALVTFTATVEDQQGMINLCLPFLTLEGILPKLSARYWFAAQEGEVPAGFRRRIAAFLENAEVNLTALAGEAQLTVRELLDLLVGDVIVLNKQIGDPLVMYVEQQPKFAVQVGVLGEHLGVQVMDWIREAE